MVEDNAPSYPATEDINQWLKPLIDHSRDAFWIRSIDYKQQIYISPAFEKIWGYGCETLYQHPEKWVEAIVLEDYIRLIEDIQKRNSPIIAPGQRFFQWYRIIRSNNEIRWIEDESFAIFNNAGDHIGFAGIAHDITEKKNKEIQLEEAKNQAETAIKVKNEFLANMSHDIKTPLAGIISGAEVLTTFLKNDFQKSLAQDIHLAGSRLLDFFNNCLELFKQEITDITLNTEDFNFKSIIHDLELLFKPALSTKNISLQINYINLLPDTLQGSAACVYRVLLNLLSNALKFTHKGNVTVTILFNGQTQEKTPTITVAITDTGIGIPHNKLETIFERLVRLTPSYKGLYEGSGIGLYTVKKYLDTVGGNITVVSTENQGSCFTVTFPVSLSTPQAIPTPE